MAKKWRLGSFILGAFLVTLGVSIGVCLVIDMQKAKIVSLEAGIVALKSETVPMRFMVSSREGGSLSVRMRFYDLSGVEFASAERVFQGRQLYFDFLVLPFGDSYLGFPFRVFTDAVAAADGFDLGPLVAPSGAPLTYRGGLFNEASLAEMGTLHESLRAGQPVKGAFGNAVHDVAELGVFELDTVYRIVLRTKGGIEIMED